MKADVYDIKGKKVKEIELNDDVFSLLPNRFSIYEAIKNELANKRQGTSSVKTKAEVSGTGAKPWKQKGTGRARVGTKRNPVWTGGGVAFGPKPRDYSYKLPKKVKNLAYRSVFSLKMGSNDVVIIDKIEVESGKTKDFLDIVSNLMKKDLLKEEKISLILNESDELVYRASRNLPWVNNLNCNRMNVHDLYYSKKIVLTEDAVMKINNNLNKCEE